MARERRIPESTSDYARWLAARLSERAGAAGTTRGASLSPETTLFVAMALESYAQRMDEQAIAKLAFVVAAVDEHGREDVLAASCNVSAAWDALRALIPHRPNGKMILRHHGRIVGRYPDDGSDATRPPRRV